MRQYPLNRYVPGTYKRECDRCGWDYLRTELVREYDTNLLVCPSCLFEPDPRLHKTNNITEQPFKGD